jgi:hypothetical protein
LFSGFGEERYSVFAWSEVDLEAREALIAWQLCPPTGSHADAARQPDRSDDGRVQPSDLDFASVEGRSASRSDATEHHHPAASLLYFAAVLGLWHLIRIAKNAADKVK